MHNLDFPQASSPMTALPVLQGSCKQEQLPETATKILAHLLPLDRFCLWLTGDLGAGKTTTTGSLLYNIGLDKNNPVTSPTFTYMIEYCIDNHWYAHMDFYRVSLGTSCEDLGIFLGRSYRGLFVEWPTRVEFSPFLRPTHELQLEHTGEDSRAFRLLEYRQAHY